MFQGVEVAAEVRGRVGATAGVEVTAEAEGGGRAEVVWHKGVPLTVVKPLSTLFIIKVWIVCSVHGEKGVGVGVLQGDGVFELYEGELMI